VSRRLGQLAIAAGGVLGLALTPVGCTTTVSTHSGHPTPCNSPGSSQPGCHPSQG
jgi:hypothetical protein